MNDKSKGLKKQELELIEQTELFMEEVYKDPDVVNVKAPSILRERVFKEIHIREAEKAERTREMLCNEDKELIRLGKLYKRRRKVRKYLVLAAALVCVVAFGITSIGDSEKIFETLNWKLADREQVNVDSEDESVVPIENIEEEQVYEQIEDKFGFYPVKLDYLPEGVDFIEADISEEIQYAYMMYGEDDLNISYQIRPHYRESSWGKDIEDELVEESEIMVNDVEIYLKKYRVIDGTERWLVGFEHKNTSYSILLMNLKQEEVTNIINGLYFP